MATPTPISMEAHWRAIYTAMRTGLDADGHVDADVVAIHTGDNSPLLESVEPPLVTYRQDVERNLGTVAGGAAKVLRSNWIITSRSVDIGEALALASSVVSNLTDASLTTTDGYSTVTLQSLGVQTMYETDSQLWAVHVRMEWTRSR